MALFKGISKDRSNAHIGWMNNKARFYQEGYKIAAEKLSEGFENLPPQERDTMIFPIIFLYRHHIELSVKAIITDIRNILSVSNGKDIGHHRILDLWDEVEILYGKLSPTVPQSIAFTSNKDLARAGNIIKELSKTDGLSFSFRYSTDKKGNEMLKDHPYISLNNFQNKLSIVTTVIEQLIETIALYEDYALTN